MKAKSVACLFPGQGSQYIGMGREIADRYQAAKEIFLQADEVLGFSISQFCFQGPEEKLLETSLTQPAILTTSIACYEVFKEEGMTPAYVAGHSLGEYSALVAAGAIAFQEAVLLVHLRGRYMQEAVPSGQGTMAAILGLEFDNVEKVCSKVSGLVEIANLNCPGQTVISGETLAVEKAMELAKSEGARKCVSLKVSGPFHSSLMVNAGELLAQELEKVTIKEPRIPVIFNVNADYLVEPDEIKEALIRQVSNTVRWEESMRRLQADGAEIFVEVGPGKVLSGLMRKIDRNGTVSNLEDLNSLKKTLALVKETGLK